MKITNLVIKHLPAVCRFNELYKAVEFIYSCIQMQMMNPGKEVGGELRALRKCCWFSLTGMKGTSMRLRVKLGRIV